MKVEFGQAYRSWPLRKITLPIELTAPTLWVINLNGIPRKTL